MYRITFTLLIFVTTQFIYAQTAKDSVLAYGQQLYDQEVAYKKASAECRSQVGLGYLIAGGGLLMGLTNEWDDSSRGMSVAGAVGTAVAVVGLGKVFMSLGCWADNGSHYAKYKRTRRTYFEENHLMVGKNGQVQYQVKEK